MKVIIWMSCVFVLTAVAMGSLYSIANELPLATTNARMPNATRAVLLRLNELRDVDVPKHLQGFEKHVGSPERGYSLLTGRLSCLNCHSIVPGEETGFPNLSDVGRRLSLTQLITSILEPSSTIADGYQNVTIMTTAGRVIRGTLVEHESNQQVATVMTGKGKTTIPHDEIEGDVVVGKSDMPEGQVDEFKPREFADLIAFLSSLGRGDSVAAK